MDQIGSLIYLRSKICTGTRAPILSAPCKRLVLVLTRLMGSIVQIVIFEYMYKHIEIQYISTCTAVVAMATGLDTVEFRSEERDH